MIKELIERALRYVNEKIPEYGTIRIEIHQGQISVVEVAEKHKIALTKN